jgi:hypothetical protein
MKLLSLLLFAALTVLGCNSSPSPTPSPTVDAAAPQASAVAQAALHAAVDEEPVRVHPPPKPFVPKPDPRTPAQIISAACAPRPTASARRSRT